MYFPLLYMFFVLLIFIGKGLIPAVAGICVIRTKISDFPLSCVADFRDTACVCASPVIHRLDARWTRPWQNETGSAVFREQMKNPSEVFAVMLIIGGDIVQKAIAQMSGKHITLIAFSFGWVAYSFNALMSAFGDGTLMPDPEFSAEIITISSRVKKANKSWGLCRLIRDLEYEVDNKFDTWYEIVEGGQENDLVRTNNSDRMCRLVGEGSSPLLVTFCTALEGAGSPRWDWHVYIVLFSVIIVQLGVAVIPTIFYGNWTILFITAIGTAMAITTASLREWRLEKYAARRNSPQTYAITRGNGHPHVFIIEPGPKGKGPGLYLHDLASTVRNADAWTRTKLVILAVIWIAFLIAAAGLSDDTWYLLIVGIIGMAQNVWVAGRHQHSAAHGLPVQLGYTYGRRKRGKIASGLTIRFSGRPVFNSSGRGKAMTILMDVERARRGVGLALLPEFFPNAIQSKEEKEWWGKAEKHLENPEVNEAPKPFHKPKSRRS